MSEHRIDTRRPQRRSGRLLGGRVRSEHIHNCNVPKGRQKDHFRHQVESEVILAPGMIAEHDHADYWDEPDGDLTLRAT